MNKWIKLEEWLMKKLMILITFFIIGLMLFIIATIVVKGSKGLSWEIVSQTPKGGFYMGEGGGILNAIIGSLYIGFGATLLATFISTPIALFMNVFLVGYKTTLQYIRLLLDVLWGIPSIVYGAFGFSIMLWLGMRSSLLAGIIVVALLIIPIMIRTMDEAMRHIPYELMEVSYALGANTTETAFLVYFRYSITSFFTAFLLAFGRGIGDAASVLFTVGYTDYIPTSLSQPTATLPLAIFFQLGSPIQAVKDHAFAAALILTIIVLLTSLSARYLSRTFKK